MLIGSPPSTAHTRSSGVPFARLALEELAEALGHLGVLDPLEPLDGDGGDRGIDAPDDVGPAGGRVLVGGLVKALDGQLDRCRPVQAVAVAELDRGAGVAATGAGGVEVALLVTPAREVVLE